MKNKNNFDSSIYSKTVSAAAVRRSHQFKAVVKGGEVIVIEENLYRKENV